MKYYILSFIALCMLFSCHVRENKVIDSFYIPSYVEFSVATTKSYTERFQEGDTMGVYVVQRTGSQPDSLLASGNYADNKKFVFDGFTFVPAEPGDRIPYPAGSILDFYCYFPYKENLESPLSLPVESGKDILTAVNREGRRGIINLLFRHALSELEVEIDNPTQKDITSIQLVARAKGLFNLATSETVFQSTLNSLIPFTPEDGIVHKAIIPSQTFATGTQLLRITENGGTYSYKATEDILLKPGTTKNIPVEIGHKVFFKVQRGGHYVIEEGYNKHAVPDGGSLAFREVTHDGYHGPGTVYLNGKLLYGTNNRYVIQNIRENQQVEIKGYGEMVNWYWKSNDYYIYSTWTFDKHILLNDRYWRMVPGTSYNYRLIEKGRMGTAEENQLSSVPKYKITLENGGSPSASDLSGLSLGWHSLKTENNRNTFSMSTGGWKVLVIEIYK